ncbi:MAG: AraC family transcriptional regulator [Provencibacterium sp.]|jgi:two-component system response regulator YesN|nr:AraC family transcriptional regulator [Provencibacterium sp.]
MAAVFSKPVGRELWKRHPHNLRKLFEQRSYFSLLLVTYLTLLFCTLLVSVLFYLCVLPAMVRSAQMQQTVILNQGAFVVDSYLSGARTEALQIAQTQYAENVARQKGAFSAQDYYAQYQLSQFLSRRTNDNPVILDYYLYFENLGCIFSSQSKFDGEDYYQNHLYAGRPFSELSALTKENHFSEVLQMRSLTNPQRDVLPLVQSIPATGPEILPAVVIVHLDLEAIRQIFGRFIESNDAAIYLFDERGRFIAGIGEHLTEPPPELAALEGSELLNLSGARSLACSYVSAQSGWKYVTSVPEKAALGDAFRHRDILFGFVACELLMGLALSFLLARGAHRPLRRFAQRLADADGPAGEENKNELLYIEKIVERSIRERNNMEQKIEHYTPILASNLLLKVITGTFSEGDASETLADNFGLRLDAPYKRVLVYRVGATGHVFSEDAAVELATVKFVLINILDDLFSRSFSAYACETGRDDVAVLLGMDTLDREAELEEISQYASSFMLQNFGVEIQAGAGEAYPALSQAGQSYTQALSALQKGVINHSASLQFLDSASAQGLVYPFDQFEERLKNLIRSGEDQKAIALLDDAVCWPQERSLDPQMTRCHFFSLMAVSLRLTAGQDTPAEDTAAAIARCTSLPAIRDCLAPFITAQCEEHLSGQKKRADRLCRRIDEIIETEYGNADLCLTFIADRLQMNASYLSTLFKRQTGRSLIDAIQAVRVAHAGDLLLNTELDIGRIAQQVGYSNYSALIRAFKKLYGITPGQYRSIHMKK